MDLLLELLKITIPGAIVGLTVYVMLQSYFKNEDEKRKHELKIKQAETGLPLKFQAHERLVLLMERITPQNLLTRMNFTNMSPNEITNEIISAINMEFDHNVSQQLYVTDTAWNAIMLAKEKLIQVATICNANTDETTTPIEFINSIFVLLDKEPMNPMNQAIYILKKDVNNV